MGVDQRFGLLEHDGSTIFGGLVCCIAELPQLVILYFMEVNVMVHKVQVYCHSAAIMFMKKETDTTGHLLFNIMWKLQTYSINHKKDNLE
ncbi:hypothetical protein KY290_016563 [Solanum tuberosum]|uniref:Uncharacterized protein n=1 Tax=Solanum tuberosum TaxID=4113 RepID=A0ABQ7V8S4_SOLTU|nr:hypothetical protein KY284_015843 [Solanum tuberosum]KAH0760490.1 hypothetical protein KY290_016563 [Solanum tuberosum]